MKLILLLIFIVGICGAIYLFCIHIKKINWKALIIAGSFGLVLLILMGIAIYQGSKAPDTWCSKIQNTTTYPPAQLKTSTDYFEQGNYNYDRGDCKGAVTDYTKSIQLDGKYPQAFNNKAYAEMRMQNYKDALTDLNKAIELKPDYVNAIMNRGDIYNNYLKDKTKAIADYKKVIELGVNGTSVCGHLFLAEHNGWSLNTVLSLPFMMMECN